MAVRHLKLAPKAEELSDLEAWAVVRKALGRSGYYWEEEYAKLPKPVRKAVGHAYNLREWSQMETDTVESVIQSQFLRSYRTILSREEELRKLPKPIRDRLESRMYGLNEITAE